MHRLRTSIAVILGFGDLVSGGQRGSGRHRHRHRIRIDDEIPIITHDDIPITSTLEWKPCYLSRKITSFSCANLEVPLDYDNPAGGSTHVAFIRHAGIRSESGEDILINPGGPGASGIEFLLEFADGAHNDRIFPQKYNLVSFDPRGVHFSGINVDCFVLNQQHTFDEFAPSEETKTSFGLQRAQLSRTHYLSSQPEVIQSGDLYGMRNMLAQAEAFGDFCTRAYNGSNAKYAGTVAVAHDLLHFIRLRAKSQKKHAEDIKLNFFGASYGSVIGTTFAAIYPHYVGRMLLDGVEDVSEYYNGDHNGSITQLDAIVGLFFDRCYHDGWHCAFFKNDSSPTTMQARFDAILEDLRNHPIAISDPSQNVGFPTIATAHNLLETFIFATYDAYTKFPKLAEQILWFEDRTQKVASILDDDKINVAGYDCSYHDEESSRPTYDSSMSLEAITCIDTQARGRSAPNKVEELRELLNDTVKVSKYFGALWTGQGSIWCGYINGIKPPKSQVFPGFPSRIKTATPILFLANRLDPVTPAANKVAAIFENSVVVTQNTIGHCAWSTGSECLERHVNRYFDRGDLPVMGTTCDDAPLVSFDKSRLYRKRTARTGDSFLAIGYGDARRIRWKKLR